MMITAVFVILKYPQQVNEPIVVYPFQRIIINSEGMDY